MWIGEKLCQFDTPVRLVTTKNNGEKRIMIGRNYGFFVIADLVSFLRNDWNGGSILNSR